MRRKGAFLTILWTLLTAALLWTASVAAQDELKPVPEAMRVGFESIKGQDAVNYVDFLASDDLEGRDTASRGMRVARRYVASLYQLWGLKPSGDMLGDKRTYHQVVRMQEILPGGESWLEVSDGARTARFESGSDVFLGRGGGPAGELEAPVVFVGYGISAPELNYDDLAGVDVKGKIALVISALPGGDRKDSPFANPEAQRRYAGMYRYREMAELFRAKGAIGVITVTPADAPRMMGRFRRNEPEHQDLGGDSDYKQGARIESPNRRLTVPELSSEGELVSIMASEKVADAVLASSGKTMAGMRAEIDKDLKPRSMDLPGVKAKLHIESVTKPIASGNVLGYIEGSDPELKSEMIVIGGHLDHLGMNDEGYVFNGADDNASGSAGVLELAQAFTSNPVTPKRSIMFACWTGEEKGLFGSRYWVKFPTLKDMKVIAYINMDMISRDYTPEQAERMKRLYPDMIANIELNEKTLSRFVGASVSAQAPLLKEIIDRVNKDYVGMLCITRSSARNTGGSDHAPFHTAGIPAAAFMAAMHDDYHQPGDSVEKANGEKMEGTIKIIYLTAFELGNLAEAPTWTDVPEEEAQPSRR